MNNLLNQQLLTQTMTNSQLNPAGALNASTMGQGNNPFGDLVVEHISRNLPEGLSQCIRTDVALPVPQQHYILHNLRNSPDFAGSLLSGTAGAAFALAVARWQKMSPTAQVLMSLAGYGLGNIILNKINPPKFTDWDSNTGKVHVL